jgi:hypothetical protein
LVAAGSFFGGGAGVISVASGAGWVVLDKSRLPINTAGIKSSAKTPAITRGKGRAIIPRSFIIPLIKT